MVTLQCKLLHTHQSMLPIPHPVKLMVRMTIQWKWLRSVPSLQESGIVRNIYLCEIFRLIVPYPQLLQKDFHIRLHSLSPAVTSQLTPLGFSFSGSGRTARTTRFASWIKTVGRCQTCIQRQVKSDVSPFTHLIWPWVFVPFSASTTMFRGDGEWLTRASLESGE